MNITNTTTHPIYDPASFYIETPAITSLKDKILSWIYNGATGGFVLGPFRTGKTKAIEMISDELTNRLGEKVHAHCIIMPRRDRNTVATVFRELCKSLGIITKKSATSDEMSSLVLHRFSELAALNSTRQVVLFVDEMHRLTLPQIEVFAEVYDQLRDAKFNICIVFVGNKEASLSLLGLIRKKRNELIRGRFFTNRHNFKGITSKKQLSKCLQQIDRIKMSDGVSSLTQHFVAENLGSQWKFASIAREIWNVFDDDFKRPQKLSSWPMQYFVSTIRILLSDYLSRYDGEDLGALEEMIYQSIKASGIEPCILEKAA